MGATTTISVFHHDRYRSCVVPAVRRLLRSGELGPWLQAVWDHRQSRYPATAGRPFSFEPNGHAEAVLDADLIEAAGSDGEWFYLPAKQTMERANVIDVFQAAIEGCCLGGSASMRTYHWTDFTEDDDDLVGGVELHEMLWRLTNRAQVWNDRNRSEVEGVRGWLDPTETAVLARELHRTALPSRRPDQSLINASPTTYYHQEFLFYLFQIRGIADQAWGMGQGVLCDTSLEDEDHQNSSRFTAPHTAFATETVQLLARAIRDRREFDVLPVLADALQEAGCENDVVLAHCRDANEHTDACWVADLILANERAP